MPLDEARVLCRKLDKQYPDVNHWPEPAYEDHAPLQDEPDEWTQQDEDNWIYQQITK